MSCPLGLDRSWVIEGDRGYMNHSVVLVTGGTKGIGKAVTVEFLRQGAIVIATYASDHDAAEQFQLSLTPAFHSRLWVQQCPASDYEKTTSLCEAIETRWGQLDGVVNNAGITSDSLFLDMEMAAWKKVLKANLGGAMMTSLAAIDLLSRNRRATFLINISSVSGLYGRAGQANYATSKGGIIGLTKLLARQYADRHIQINCLVPGLIETDMANKMPPDKVTAVEDATFLKRIGTVQEVSDAVLYLAGKGGSYMSGSVLCLDGGFFK